MHGIIESNDKKKSKSLKKQNTPYPEILLLNVMFRYTHIVTIYNLRLQPHQNFKNNAVKIITRGKAIQGKQVMNTN